MIFEPMELEWKPKDDSIEKFIDSVMKDSLKYVDITGFSSDAIKHFISQFPDTKNLVTTDVLHFTSLVFTPGFMIHSNGDSTLYGLPIILDTQKELNTAKVEVCR